MVCRTRGYMGLFALPPHYPKGTAQRNAGFTLVELLVTLALIGIAAAVVLPMATLMETRAKEAELRQALRVLRKSIDDYKAAADAGLIEKTTGSSGYPPSLDVLVTGVPRTTVFGFNATPILFLRKVPRDPFYPDKSVPAAQTWNLRRYGAQPSDFSPGPDVFDVSSKSSRQALDGSSLDAW
jgi:general secretion pathway protein G